MLLLYRYSEEVALLLEQEAELADYIDNIEQINIKKNSDFIFFQVRGSIVTIQLPTIYRAMTVLEVIILSFQSLLEMLVLSETSA